MRNVLIVLAVCIAMVAAGGWVRGMQAEKVALTGQLATANNQVKELKKIGKVEASQAASVVHTVVQTNTVFRTITKEVDRYVASNPAHCTLSAGWVQQYNSAIRATASQSAGVSPGTSASAAIAASLGK